MHVIWKTELTLQGTPFCVDLHILPLHGTKVVLGLERLGSLAITVLRNRWYSFMRTSWLYYGDYQKMTVVYSMTRLISYAAVFEVLELDNEEPVVTAPPSDGPRLSQPTLPVRLSSNKDAQANLIRVLAQYL